MERAKSVLFFLLSFLILEFGFAIHEYGHLQEFQKHNVPIEEYSLGVGPKIWHRQASAFEVSIRLIPIMAYVTPTDEGAEFFERHVSLLGKIAIYAAGVRNNFLIGLSVVFFLQFLGWTRGNLSSRELAMTMMATPPKMALRFFAFLAGCATFGRVKLANRFFLSTGGIYPPSFVKKLILFNLGLGIFNLAPIPPLDGGHAVQAIIAAGGNHLHALQIPSYIGAFLLPAFYFVACHQDMRILEIDS